MFELLKNNKTKSALGIMLTFIMVLAHAPSTYAADQIKGATSKVGEAAGVFTHETGELHVTVLGRWSSQALKTEAGTQIAIQNGNSLKGSLDAGPITVGDIYKIMPFDHRLVIMDLKGSDIKIAIDHGIMNPDIADGQFAGLIVEFDENKEFGNRITKISLEDGTPLESDKYYSLATSDFLLAGGDQYDFSRGINVVSTDVPVRDLLIEAIEKQKIISPEAVDYMTEISNIVEIPAADKKVQIYIVKSGDILGRIAKKFNTTWKELARFNNMKNPHLIYPNQKVLIPLN